MNYKISKVNRLVWAYIFIGHNTLLPLAVAAENTTKTETKRNKFSRYIVQVGDSLSSIAKAHRVDVAVFVLSTLISQQVSALTLSELISLSISRYPSIKSSESLHGATQAEEDAAWNQFLPTPSVNYNADRKVDRATVALQQPMWWFSGTEEPTYQAAQSRVVGASAGVFEARDKLALRVLNAYGSWLNSVERIEVARHDIHYFDGLLKQIGRRVSSGASASVERELVISRSLSTQGILAASQASRQAALEQLSQFIGEPLANDVLSSGKTSAPVLPEQNGLLNESLARSPTLQRLASESKALEYEVQARREALKPQLYVRAEQTWQEGFGSEQSVSLGVQWTPGAGLSGLSAVRAVGQRMNAAQQIEDSARRQIHEEIGSTYSQYEGTRERLALQLDSLKTLIAIRDSYLRQFMAGRRQWQEVMNAVRDVSDARYSIADMRASLLISGYQILLLAKGDAAIAGVQPLMLEEPDING